MNSDPLPVAEGHGMSSAQGCHALHGDDKQGRRQQPGVKELIRQSQMRLKRKLHVSSKQMKSDTHTHKVV